MNRLPKVGTRDSSQPERGGYQGRFPGKEMLPVLSWSWPACILHSSQQAGLGLLLVFCFEDLSLVNFWKVPEPSAWQARSSLPYWALLNSGFNFHYGEQACHQAALLKLKCVHCSFLRVCLIGEHIFWNVSWGSPSWSSRNPGPLQ